jgi:hypothetical protein
VPNFPKGHYAHEARAANARRIAALEPDAPVTHTHRGFEFPDPVDMRGIPAVGRGCGGGAVRGSRPGDGLFR